MPAPIRPPAPLLLASVSPQRRAILTQLGIPFETVSPRYRERDRPGADPIELVETHARGKALSVVANAGKRPVLGVDTTVALEGKLFGKAADEHEAAAMLAQLGGKTHEVLSGLCLLGPEEHWVWRERRWEEVAHEITRVTFRPLSGAEIAAYLASGEWRERAGSYAIQGLGARLVERIEGDYLNVVGLPAALLVSTLARRFPGVYGLG